MSEIVIWDFKAQSAQALQDQFINSIKVHSDTPGGRQNFISSKCKYGDSWMTVYPMSVSSKVWFCWLWRWLSWPPTSKLPVWMSLYNKNSGGLLCRQLQTTCTWTTINKICRLMHNSLSLSPLCATDLLHGSALLVWISTVCWIPPVPMITFNATKLITNLYLQGLLLIHGDFSHMVKDSDITILCS